MSCEIPQEYHHLTFSCIMLEDGQTLCMRGLTSFQHAVKLKMEASFTKNSLEASKNGISQQKNICTKSTIESLRKGVKDVQN